MQIKNKHIFFESEDLINQQNIEKIGDILVGRLKELHFTKKTSKIIFATFIESSQNVLHYYNDTFKKDFSDFSSSFVCYKKDNTIYLSTANTILKEDMIILGKKCDYINSLNLKKLEKYYDIILSKDSSKSQAAGLGLIEIAIKTKSKLNYFVEKQKNNMFNFLLKIEIKE